MNLSSHPGSPPYCESMAFPRDSSPVRWKRWLLLARNHTIERKLTSIERLGPAPQKIRALLAEYTAPLKGAARKRRRVSEEGRARIVAAQKERWAKAKRHSAK